MSQIDRLGLLRYSERLLIVVGGGPFFAYLGYRLFAQGIIAGEGRFEGRPPGLLSHSLVRARACSSWHLEQCY